MNTSRRDFLKVAGGTAALATVPAMAVAHEAPAAAWDAEFDVVVIGFGFAGASSAITAAEAGAKVLLIDKAPLDMEGGNSRFCAQLCLSFHPENRDKCITYYKGLRGLYDDQGDDIVEAIVDGLLSTRAWLEGHGMEPDQIMEIPFPEYPELEGSDGCTAIMYKGSFLSEMYKWIHKLVMANENITFWPETPAVKLVQDCETRIVEGVVVENGGERYNVRAKNGVIMALGGFENNQQMLQNFVQQPNAYPHGARFNTGDGVKMAIEVGADLWHMSALSGADVNFIDPMTGVAAGYALTTPSASNYATGFTRYNVIMVGGDGTRFFNEGYFPRHGHIPYGGTYRSTLVPDNAWCIFDETARLTCKAFPNWSEGMEEEIEMGWILKADTLEELAALTGVNAEGLVKTVEEFNGFCANGVDYRYDRNPEHMLPLETAPYYAFEVRPCNTNTQGGARRDAQCRVLDTDRNPIPHLFSAGEFGSFYADVYNGGGNVGECIFTGEIAGKAAAAVKDDVDQASQLTGEPVDFTATRPDFTPEADNEFIGVGEGIGGDLVAKVTMDGDTIASIKVLYHHETPNLGSKAIASVTERILETQQTVVDVFTSATVTSNALMQAVNDALGTGIVVGVSADHAAFQDSVDKSLD